MTVPSTSIASFLATGGDRLLVRSLLGLPRHGGPRPARRGTVMRAPRWAGARTARGTGGGPDGAGPARGRAGGGGAPRRGGGGGVVGAGWRRVRGGAGAGSPEGPDGAQAVRDAHVLDGGGDVAD